jgi:hypothetical protein
MKNEIICVQIVTSILLKKIMSKNSFDKKNEKYFEYKFSTFIIILICLDKVIMGIFAGTIFFRLMIIVV